MKCVALPLAVAALVSLISAPTQAQSPQLQPTLDNEPARQFDFWIGKWDVNLRIRQPDLSWRDSIRATAYIYPVLGGKAIVELWDSQPIKGFSLRYFDRQRKKWVLFLDWPSPNRSSISSLAGGFRHGRGEFFSHQGEQLSRYTFSDITKDSLRWDDAFSKDGGKTWTHNWIMEFQRTADTVAWPDSGRQAPTYVDGRRCKNPSFRFVNRLAGIHKGEVTFPATEAAAEATLRAYRILDGCAVICFVTSGTHSAVSFLTFNPGTGKYEELYLDDQADTPARRLIGGPATKETISLTAENSLKRTWRLSKTDEIQVVMFTSSDQGDTWTPIQQNHFAEAAQPMNGESTVQDQQPVGAEHPINDTCPRSGKPVVMEALAKYRGYTVGFCNTHCRDDFAAHVDDRPDDRAFFDELIIKLGQ